jgi:hypothetical protein
MKDPDTRWCLVGVAILLFAVFATRRDSDPAADREAMRAFSSKLALGMPREEVNRLCQGVCQENAGWDFYADADSQYFGVPISQVRTPLTFGANNWVLYIAFEDNAVAAVLMRTEDSPKIRTEGAPPDRVADPGARWLTNFVYGAYAMQ